MASAEGTIYPSAVYPIGTIVTPPIANPAAKGVRLFIDVTVPNGGTVTVSIEEQDPASGKWILAADGAITTALAAAATTSLTIYPGIAETPNFEISDHLGTPFRVKLVVAAAPVTLSVGGVFLS